VRRRAGRRVPCRRRRDSPISQRRSLRRGSCGASARVDRITSKGSSMRRSRSAPRSAFWPASAARSSRSGVASRRSSSGRGTDLARRARVLSVRVLAIIPSTPRRGRPARCRKTPRGRRSGGRGRRGSPARRPPAVFRGPARDRCGARRRRPSPPDGRFLSSGGDGVCWPSCGRSPLAAERSAAGCDLCSLFVLFSEHPDPLSTYFLIFHIVIIRKTRIYEA